VPVRHPRRAGVVTVAAEVEPPPAVRPDRAGHAHRHLECPSLLDVQLDGRREPRAEIGQGAAGPGAERVGERQPVPIA
jgi:hypothetical protein